MRVNITESGLVYSKGSSALPYERCIFCDFLFLRPLFTVKAAGHPACVPALCTSDSVCKDARGAVRRKFWDRGHNTPNTVLPHSVLHVNLLPWMNCQYLKLGTFTWNSGYFCLFGKLLVLDPLDRNVHSTFHSVPCHCWWDSQPLIKCQSSFIL